MQDTQWLASLQDFSCIDDAGMQEVAVNASTLSNKLFVPGMWPDCLNKASLGRRTIYI